MVKAADMLIARRADTRARADFATWKMMAKLNGASALPAEAQEFLVSYKNLLARMSEGEATEAHDRRDLQGLLCRDGRRGNSARRPHPSARAGGGQCYRFPPPASETDEDGLLYGGV
ncbi:hypothetical protein AB7M74_005297 [Bradyrhizobium japonicum]